MSHLLSIGINLILKRERDLFDLIDRLGTEIGLSRGGMLPCRHHHDGHQGSRVLPCLVMLMLLVVGSLSVVNGTTRVDDVILKHVAAEVKASGLTLVLEKLEEKLGNKVSNQKIPPYHSLPRLCICTAPAPAQSYGACGSSRTHSSRS